tara:strand:- start:191 stop:514 length:324 start_codon:yes stop_codon:yes gene_type:complete
MWNVVERLEKKEPLPNLVRVVGRNDYANDIVESQDGDKWKNFLRFNSAWLKLKQEYPNLVHYVWRNIYTGRAQMKFTLSVPEVAFIMRHSIDIHNRKYSQLVTDDNI